MDYLEMTEDFRDKDTEDYSMAKSIEENNHHTTNIMLETIRIKDEQSNLSRDDNEIKVNSRRHSSLKSEDQTTFMDIDTTEEEKTVKEEKSEKLGNIDTDYESNDYQLLKDLLEEVKNSVEKAQECAIKISQEQIITSSQYVDYFAKVASAIDKAITSTEMGLAALNSILNLRDEEKYQEAALKEEIQDVSDDDAKDMVELLTPRLSIENDSKDETLFCNLCDYSTTIPRYLRHHQRQKHEPKKFKCEDCSYLAIKPSEMKTHMRRRHDIHTLDYICERENPEVKHYLCQHCHYANTCQKELQKHAAESHNLIDDGDGVVENETENRKDDDLMEESVDLLSCTRCSYTTKNRVYFDDHVNGIYKYTKCPWCDRHSAKGVRKFALHLRSKHGLVIKDEIGDEFYKCPDCLLKFPNTRKLLFHVRDVHKVGPKFHCSKCDYSGTSMVYLKCHMEDHNDATFGCTQCPHIAKSKHRLQKHMYNSHGQGILCDDCGAVYSTNSALKLHKKTCSKKFKVTSNSGKKQRYVPMITCSHCNFSTRGLEKLKRHYTEEHKEYGSNKEIEQKCDFCDHVSTSIVNMRYHYTVEHKEKTLKCDQCDFESPTEGYMRDHKEKKHTSTSFPCEICGMVFKLKETLKRHNKNKHSTNPTRLSCKQPGCEYTASTQFSIKLHFEKVHLGIKWPCNLCEYIGPYKGDLTRHMKKVHNVFPEGCMIRCDLCDFTVNKSSTLIAHKKKVHGVETS